jgi:hydrogenase nickel incorporation protein HypA/HybF
VHEYSLIQSLVGRVEAEVQTHHATSVRRIKLRVGELSGVDADLLATAYDTFRAGTVCRAAELEIERVPARWACQRCGVPVRPGGPLRCPECHDAAALVEGDDIILSQVELEVPDV